MPRSEHKTVAGFEVGVVPVCLSGATIFLGFIGWAKIDYDGSAHSLLMVVFKALGGSRSSGGSAAGHNLWTDAASIGGLLSVYSWFAALLWGYLRGLIIRLAARVFYRDHVVVIGDTPFARRASRAWRNCWRRPLHIVETDDIAADMAPRSISGVLNADLCRTFALARAGHVLVDLGDNMRTLTLSLDLLGALSRTGDSRRRVRPKTEWIIVVDDVPLADHFTEKVRELERVAKVALPDMHYLDPQRLAIRYFMAERPLFLMAEKAGQDRVHVLIFGFGAIGRHLAELSILTSLAGMLASPCVTVLTAHADAERRRFLAGRPVLMEEIDIAFLELDGLEDFQIAETPAAVLLRAREEKASFTAAFLTSSDSQENVRTALLIDDIHRKSGRLDCPLYSYEEKSEDATFLTAGAGRLSEIVSGFATFDLPENVLATHLSAPELRDGLAKALHERYAGGGSNDWYSLSESMRRANRNAADHWRAMVFTLGFDVKLLPPFRLAKMANADADRIEGAAADDRLILWAARCEHERWVSERRLDGWSYGATRDDARQLHPLLVTWDVLRERFPDDVSKNVEQVKAVVRYLARHGDPRVALQWSPVPAETVGRQGRLLKDV